MIGLMQTFLQKIWDHFYSDMVEEEALLCCRRPDSTSVWWMAAAT